MNAAQLIEAIERLAAVLKTLSEMTSYTISVNDAVLQDICKGIAKLTKQLAERSE